MLLAFGFKLFTGTHLPHYTTIIQQTLKVGLARLRNATKKIGKYVAIIDHSIKIGKNKIFVVLRAPLDTLERSNRAIDLSHCEVIGIKIKKSWTGELVAQYLAEIFSAVGPPAQIIRDGGSDLRLGLELLQKEYSFVVTNDIGHFFANIMKKRFSETESYQRFITFVGGLSKQMALTELAHLLPPKLRTKGRFMGISRVVSCTGYIFATIQKGYWYSPF